MRGRSRPPPALAALRFQIAVLERLLARRRDDLVRMKVGAMADPWTFGLGVAGLLLTAVLGGLGLRTLDRWRRERIEEKKVDLAMDAISLAHESKGVFEGIRSRVSSMSEWDDTTCALQQPKNL